MIAQSKILREVCRLRRVNTSQVLSESREEHIVIARLYCYHAMINEGYTRKQISDFFGRDRSNITTSLNNSRKEDYLLNLSTDISTKTNRTRTGRRYKRWI